jgi:hypothetical protein
VPATLVSSNAGPGRGALRALALAALAPLAAAGCAGLGSDVHLSPFVSGLSTAGGGHEIEALAGAVLVRRSRPGGPVDQWAVRPLVSERITPAAEEGAGSVRRGYYLVPFGTWIAGDDEDVAQLLPLYRYHSRQDAHGHPEWHLFVFPFLLWSHDPHGRTLRAVFPIAGVTEHFLSFDRVTFFLFPLFVKTERGEVTGWHLLWPIFRLVTDVEGVRGWRVWPLFGWVHLPNYERYFFLWPIFHYQKNNLTSPEEEHETRWMVFPLFGRARAGSFRAWTFLWPFFGFSRNPDEGFWAWDGPWPLVRIQRPGPATTPRARASGRCGRATRTRGWTAPGCCGRSTTSASSASTTGNAAASTSCPCGRTGSAPTSRAGASRPGRSSGRSTSATSTGRRGAPPGRRSARCGTRR